MSQNMQLNHRPSVLVGKWSVWILLLNPIFQLSSRFVHSGDLETFSTLIQQPQQRSANQLPQMISSKGLSGTRATQKHKIPTLSLIKIRAIPFRQRNCSGEHSASICVHGSIIRPYDNFRHRVQFGYTVDNLRKQCNQDKYSMLCCR